MLSYEIFPQRENDSKASTRGENLPTLGPKMVLGPTRETLDLFITVTSIVPMSSVNTGIVYANSSV